jgi:opacity protein-like surface antigen
MKSLRILSLIAVALLLAPALAAADFGVRAGRYNDGDEEFVGAELVFDLGAVKINPNIEYSLADEVTAGTANLDVTYDLVHIGSITPYVGAGVGMSYTDNDINTQTDILGNVIGGVSFKFDFLQPYAQVKYFRVLDDDNSGDAGDDIALTVGVRF